MYEASQKVFHLIQPRISEEDYFDEAQNLLWPVLRNKFQLNLVAFPLIQYEFKNLFPVCMR